MLLGTLCRERLQKWLHLMNKHLQSMYVPHNDYRKCRAIQWPPPVKDTRWMTYASCFVRCVPLRCNSLVLLGVSSFQDLVQELCCFVYNIASTFFLIWILIIRWWWLCSFFFKNKCLNDLIQFFTRVLWIIPT